MEMKGNPMNSGPTPIAFYRCITYDSAQGATVTIQFPTEKHWKITVKHIRIQLSDGNWEDPVGYLKFTLNGGDLKNFTVLNGGAPTGGAIVPIAFPDVPAQTSVFVPIRGNSLAGPSTFTPTILDSQFQTVQLTRLYLCFILSEDDGKTI